jgi:hypothetical protein
MSKQQTISWAIANNVSKVYRYTCPMTKRVLWVATSEVKANMTQVWGV